MALDSKEGDLTGIKRWGAVFIEHQFKRCISVVLETGLRFHLTSEHWGKYKNYFYAGSEVLSGAEVHRFGNNLEKVFRQFYLESLLVQAESQGESQSLFD